MDVYYCLYILFQYPSPFSFYENILDIHLLCNL